MDDKEYAFPQKVSDNLAHLGMSLRDYFAAKAMQSITKNFGFLTNRNSELFPDYMDMLKSKVKDISEEAYIVADAMMKERRNDE